jgi:two-component system, chemotaxis family, sensor kinase CheA
MFISTKRHEREKQALVSASNRLTDAILRTSSLGLFLLDSKDKIQPQVSGSLATLFRRQDFSNLSFEKLIAPLVSARTLSIARTHMARLMDLARSENEESNPLQDVEVRFSNTDGTTDTAHYSFHFGAMEIPPEPRLWLVRVTDITTRVQQHCELVDLRAQVLTQGEILRSVLQAGATRFGTFVQRTDASMKIINAVLKKPAREADAFRGKLEETLREVDRIRRDAAALKLTGLQAAAQEFEDALQELRSRATLSGSDFLPLAVKLDTLYGQFAMLRSWVSQAAPVRDAEVEVEVAVAAAAPVAVAEPDARGVETPGMETGVAQSGVMENGAQISEAPKLKAEMAARTEAPEPKRMAAAGSLDSTLATLTDLVAQEHHKTVILECSGLHLVPNRYQATIKNIAIQLIRNAVVHGVESAAERESAGKPVHGTLQLEFRPTADNGFELLFQDDGRGLNPDQVRTVAVARGLLTAEDAARLRDRQAIKLIFKSGFTTMTEAPGAPKHGAGMSLVRRYVHEAGGRIALASLLGHETRFKVTLPTLEVAADAQVA